MRTVINTKGEKQKQKRQRRIIFFSQMLLYFLKTKHHSFKIQITKILITFLEPFLKGSSVYHVTLIILKHENIAEKYKFVLLGS